MPEPEPIDTLAVVRWQFRVAWSLAADVHLPRLTSELCLWQPHPDSWTVRRDPSGSWWPDWFEPEPVDPPPPSVGWLTWHLVWWWTDALRVARGASPRDRASVSWSGSGDAVVAELRGLAEEWTSTCAGLDEAALSAPTRFPWADPRPLIYTVAWVNLELMKNIAEIGEVANLYVNR